ncbi:hypothetical protein J2810_004622 [Chryseobacterium rhizosphaerae]|uniref:hypothetical protein n=1 Tax=Chryseobacterium rhizosphaerae TaxID=395937 RepID=UPI002867246B|nr:hypothetical protein [Chryseobacterium rhizosphaerae]MDR6548532.1 hypothetical protein [Chryseobacterium rhizosphaerae]
MKTLIITSLLLVIFTVSCSKRIESYSEAEADSALTVKNFKEHNKKVEHDFNDNQWDAR